MLRLVGFDLELTGLVIAIVVVLGLVLWLVIARRGINPYAVLGLAIAALSGWIVYLLRRDRGDRGLGQRVEDATRRYEEGKKALEDATEKAVGEAKAEVEAERPPKPSGPLDSGDVDDFLNRRGRKP